MLLFWQRSLTFHQLVIMFSEYENKSVKIENGSKTRTKSEIQKEEKLKQGKCEGEAAMPALKPPYPEYTFVLGGFLIALP